MLSDRSEMNPQRRNFIGLTAAGLFHIAGRPFTAEAGEATDPKLLVRQAAARGHTDLGWLDSYHTFSFGNYYDQRHLGFRSLRVINDDRIAAGRGFPTHPHRDMEILSYVLDGSLQHRDSTGQGSVVTPGDIQMMTAGTGITHSEYNPSRQDSNHFLQIWIDPALNGLRPVYQQERVEADQKLNVWKQIAGPDSTKPDKSKGVVGIHQDAKIYATILEPGKQLRYVVERDRHAWLHVATGSATVNGTTLQAGDAIATSRPSELVVTGQTKAEALLFDLS